MYRNLWIDGYYPAPDKSIWQKEDWTDYIEYRISQMERLVAEGFTNDGWRIISIGDSGKSKTAPHDCDYADLVKWLAQTGRTQYLIHLHQENEEEKRTMRALIKELGLTEYVDEELDKKIKNYCWYYSPKNA